MGERVVRPDPDGVYRITVPVPTEVASELEHEGGGLPKLGADREIFISGTGVRGLIHSLGTWTVESVDYTFPGHPYDNHPSVYLVTLIRPVLGD